MDIGPLQALLQGLDLCIRSVCVGPIFLGAMFLIVALTPAGLAGLWDELEKRVEAGSGALLAAFPLLAFAAFLIPEMLGLMPSVLNTKVWLSLQTKYFILLVGFLVYAIVLMRRGGSLSRLSVAMLIGRAEKS